MLNSRKIIQHGYNGNSLVLDAGQFPGYEYIWEDSVTGRYLEVTTPGLYHLLIKSQDCISTDSVLVLACDDLWVPNAFTPDGDGINDFFKPATYMPLKFYNMQIFNRWGELIFESDELSNAWDGTCKGSACKQDAYIWKIEYQANNNMQTKSLNGFILLLR